MQLLLSVTRSHDCHMTSKLADWLSTMAVTSNMWFQPWLATYTNATASLGEERSCALFHSLGLSTCLDEIREMKDDEWLFVTYCICSDFSSKQCSNLQCHLEVKCAAEPSLKNKWKTATNIWDYWRLISGLNGCLSLRVVVPIRGYWYHVYKETWDQACRIAWLLSGTMNSSSIEVVSHRKAVELKWRTMQRNAW